MNIGGAILFASCLANLWKYFIKQSNHLSTMDTEKKTQRWFGLESNPALINNYIRNLGFDPSVYEFVDVFSTEDWALAMIPQPVAAVIMLYPLTEKQLSYSDDPQRILTANDKVWFTKQRIGNACGTIGILHTLLNLPEPLQAFVQPDSWLGRFREDTPIPLDPVAKAERLEEDETIATLHDRATSSEQNQTNRGNIEDRLITHFVALVHVGGHLYELDGRKDGPVEHGTTTQENLLADACRVVKSFMERDPGEMRFTILALAPKTD